jgi:hypothetical protein
MTYNPRADRKQLVSCDNLSSSGKDFLNEAGF